MVKKIVKCCEQYNVPASIEDLQGWAEIFKVLGDEIRLNILKEIIDKPGISAKEIIINLKLTQPTASFHLKQLFQANIIEYHKDGQTHCYYPNKQHISFCHERVTAACELVYNTVIHPKKK